MRIKVLLLFTLLFLPLFLLTGCREELPEISLLEPRIGRMGEILTIRGTGFGNERNESYITIAGIPPTSSSYVSWSNEEIVVRTPEFGDAGLIYVHRGPNRSNPALFANIQNLPVPVVYGEGSNPRIFSIEPSSGPIGSIITIQGSNFGSSRNDSAVFFSWNAEFSPAVPIGYHLPDFVEPSDIEFPYELWSEREIRVRVPDGAVGGNLEVRTARGNSLPVFFDITGRPGTKTFKDIRNYVITYMVDLRTERAEIPNALYIWMPRPVESASQRNVRLQSFNMEPFVHNYLGTSLFQFIDIPPQISLGINLSYLVEVYAVETNIRSQAPPRLNSPTPLSSIFTNPSPLVPSDHEAIRAKALEIIGRETLPYARAQRIYNWLITTVDIGLQTHSGGPETDAALTALEEEEADSYRAVLLFTALARAAGIPAIPVAGVLVNRNLGTTRHYWAEFWLDGFGWVPVDPALGAGAAPPDFTLREDHSEYYFGSLDNQRISFSRGEHNLLQMTPQGRTVTRNREYSLQNLWEEAVGGLESYSSLWSNVTITGMYVQ